MDDVKRARSTDFLFARKFDINHNIDAVNSLLKELGKDELME